jgi:tetratricopeptide (TPR) repeat protein
MNQKKMTMIRKKIILSLLFATICFNSFGQTFKDQYNDLVAKKDTAAQYKLLEKWKAADNNDAELYVAYFNFYITRSRTEIISIGREQKGSESLKISDSASKNIGFINSNAKYENKYLNTGFSYIDTGIYKFPARLDMRFGKIYMLGEINDYQNFTNEIIATINYSQTINNKWTWTDNKPVDDPEKFMLSSVQGYINQLYDTNNDSLLDNMKKISEAVLKYYPDHVESLSDLAIVYILQNNYDNALELLLKAEKLAPEDYVVLNNIAHVYKLKGDTENAIKYYELTAKYGDDEAKAYAKTQIKDLKKK